MAMLRLKPIRRTRRRGPSRDALRVADAAFCFALLLATIVGAGRVVSGFPRLVGLFLAPDVIAARADIAPPRDSVRMALAPGGAGTGPYSPQVLYPIVAHDFPDLRTQPDRPPSIAIVIDDLGADVVHTRRAMELPRAVALAFLPYPAQTPSLAREAGRAGHEILVHVPMQPLGSEDPGPMTLTVDQ